MNNIFFNSYPLSLNEKEIVKKAFFLLYFLVFFKLKK